MKDTLAEIEALRESGIICNSAIGGAMGATFYLEPISTYDLDIFVLFEGSPLILTLTPIYEFLKANRTRKGFRSHSHLSRSRGGGQRQNGRPFGSARSRRRVAKIRTTLPERPMTHLMDRILAAKAERRRRLMALPFPEKVRLVEQMREASRAMHEAARASESAPARKPER